ncbi:MAG: S8 family serine peptidase, partial [Gammaproteobacteria bacterium]|nr:S8 family serine peptidase [Gammaproteobacteria bacterium]
MDYFAEASACSWDGETTAPVRPLLVNMSLATTGLEFSGRGVGERKLDATVWANRQLYVVAQANAGVHGVSNYATAKNSLAVGAAADTGVVASFSSHGPTADGRLAPNVVATGVDVWSVRGQGRGSGYVRQDGTSMASPAVAGIAALLMDGEPGFRDQPALTRARIMASAVRPQAFLDARFAADNSAGPDELQNRYGLGLASARLSLLQRDREDGWTSGAAVAELGDDEYAYVDIDVPEGADRLGGVMTWDGGAAEAVTESVLNDLDLWVDAGADCGPGACGDRSSRSRIDNVEWVVVKRPAAGVHRVKVVAERIHGAAPSAAVAWTLIRGNSTPRLHVEPADAVIRTTSDRPAEIAITVTADGYVAAGSTLHLGARRNDHSHDIVVETAREDGLSREGIQSFRDAIPLGEIAAGEKQSLLLSITARRSDRFYFTASAWNAEAGTASVDIVVDGDDHLPALAAVPENDRFEQGEPIAGRSGELTFDLMLASREPGEPDVFAQLSGSSDRYTSLQAARSRSVWFTWRAPDSGTWFFRVGEAGRPGDRVYGINMAVFQGARIAALERVGANDDSALAFSAKRNEEYRIRIASTQDDVKPYMLRWEGGGDGPPNDDFAHRERITGLEGTVAGSNRGASLEPDEFFGDLTSTVWYAWTAPEDGYGEFHAPARRVYAFVGDTIANLRLVSSTRFSSSTVFPAAAGQTYRIVVGSEGTETAGGEFELSWEGASDAALEDNDAFSDATPIEGDHGSVSSVGLRGATVEEGEPPETGTQTRWWRWRAPGAGPYTLRLSGNDRTISVLNVFAGNELGHLQWLAGGQELVIHTEPGETYSISMGRRHETSFQQFHLGDLALSLGGKPPPHRQTRPPAAPRAGGGGGGGGGRAPPGRPPRGGFSFSPPSR